ncbi:flavin reductase (DIM6/NTAB) family NADH-FMN oxidoreductase RutF [Pedobacter sp. UYP30]|uniref:flavin reductase family protein n=1 Tax=Pedobacter sp. UYP30 TaxID=1756400 RepID=UPI0033991E19
MLSFKVEDLQPAQVQNYLYYAVAPRPICFASTVDKEGNVNLSPFSFFNLFSINPPICIFSPVTRMRDNSTKHTLDNVLEVKECVINIVNYAMVQQMSLASTEYGKGINEFEKAGFTMAPSTLVKPPRVLEAPVQLECRIKEVVKLGDQKGAGNLVIAEVVVIHVQEDILDDKGNIDQQKIDLVARLGGNWYARITPESLFEVEKPLRTLGIGVDALPKSVRLSMVLSGNDLGRLGNLETLPTAEEIDQSMHLPAVKEILDATIGDAKTREIELHTLAKRLILSGNIKDALTVILL